MQPPDREGDAGEDHGKRHHNVDDDAGDRRHVGYPAHDQVGDDLEQREPPERRPGGPPVVGEYVADRPADGVAEADRGTVQVRERPGAAWVVPAGGRVRVVRPLPAARRPSALTGHLLALTGHLLALTGHLLALTGHLLALTRGGVLILARGLLARDVLLRRVGVLSCRNLGRLRAWLIGIRPVGLLLTIGSAHGAPPIPPGRR